MRNLIVLFLFLLGSQSFAVPTGTQSIVGFGGAGTIGDSDYIPSSVLGSTTEKWMTLHTNIANITATNVAPLYANGVAYQVPGGKVFYVTKVCYEGTATSSPFQLLTATASFAVNATTASLTGPVYQGGAAGGHQYYIAVANTPTCKSELYQFAASTFPGIQERDASNTILVSVHGVEK